MSIELVPPEIDLWATPCAGYADLNENSHIFRLNQRLPSGEVMRLGWLTTVESVNCMAILWGAQLPLNFSSHTSCPDCTAAGDAETTSILADT